MPIPVAERVKASVCGRSPAGIAGSNPAGGHGCLVCCECCVLSGTGLCAGPIPRPEESCRLWCVIVCDLESLKKESGEKPTVGCKCQKKKKKKMI